MKERIVIGALLLACAFGTAWCASNEPTPSARRADAVFRCTESCVMHGGNLAACRADCWDLYQ